MPCKIGDIVIYDKSKEKFLDREYFRQEVVALAKDLLGKVIVH
jgi:3-methyladenine DNA glycosylase Mpg